MTRVLFIGPLPEPTTGQSLACRVFCEALRDRGRSVDIVNLNKRNLAQGLDSFGRVLEVLDIVRRVAVLQFQADAIYFTIAESRAGNLKDLLIYSVCMLNLHKMIVHLHGGAGMRALLARPGMVRRANFFFLRRMNKVVTLGPRLRQIYAGELPDGQLAVVPNFALGELFASDGEIHQKFRSRGPLNVLFLSNLVPGKGHEELLAAYRSLPVGLQRQITLDFAGMPESEEQRTAFLEQIEGLDGVRYHGVVHGSRKLDLFRRAHVFCLPTYYPYEGQPISILEAYAAGCAVITTDHSGIFDVFEDGVNGIAVEKGSAASIASALAGILDDRSRLLGMALANRRLAGSNFTVDRYTADLLTLVDKAAAGRQPG